MVQSVLAFDPGGTTGVALRDHDGSITTCTVGRPQEAWDFIQEGLDVVVYERFASSVATSHDALYTIEIIGGIQALCHRLRIPIVRHEPQNRKAWLDEARDIVHDARRVAGVPLGKLVVHEIDALAHLLCHEALGSRIVTRRWGTGISNA